MKKTLYGLILVSIFSLSACSSNKNESTTSSNKVEQLESNTQESKDSSSSSDKQTHRTKEEILSEIKSDKNRKIVTAFLDADLPIYNYSYEGVAEMLELPSDAQRPIYESGMSFYIEQGTDGVILGVENYNDEETMNEAVDYFSNIVDPPTIVKNENINSILYGSPTTDAEKKLFTKYKEIFENVK